MTDLNIYAEILISAYEHPKHKATVKDANAAKHEENISCGDKIDIYLKIKDKKIAKAGFTGTGCIISMGSADMLLDALEGKGVAEVVKMTKKDLLRIIGIDPGPVRMHCATLSLRAAKEAVFAYEGRKADASVKEL